MRIAITFALAASLLLACEDLLPVETQNLCEGTPSSAECPQCTTAPFAANCPQCRGDTKDRRCANASDAGDGGTSDVADGGGRTDGATADGGGAAGAGGTGGTGGGGASADPCARCREGEHCSDAGACVQCLDDRHCSAPEGRCDPSGNCVQCLGNSDCSDDWKCDTDEGVCRECLEHADCHDPAAGQCRAGECVACEHENAQHCAGVAERPMCDVQRRCVECLSDGDCPEASAPQCNGGSCGSCTGPAACTGRERATLCDRMAGSTRGHCVECTAADETPCEGKVCDVVSRVCTDRDPATRGICQDCVSDTECVTGHRCVPMFFKDERRDKAYCLKLPSCDPPYASTPITRASLSGAPATQYCGIDESRTSCEAIAALIDDVRCPQGSDDECGAPGAICRTVNEGTNRCTYLCSIASECPGTLCRSGYCGGP
jgi:hypothetical protein